MPSADLHAWMAGWHEPERDADILAAAEQILRIEQAEGESEQRGIGRERDVALVPAELDADRLLALVQAAGDDADIAHRCSIRAGERTSQSEAGNFIAARETRQEVLLLRVGSVFLDQLARPERVRHHHDGDAVGATR